MIHRNGLNVRYLERSGLRRPDAVAAVTLANVAGFVVHVAALALIGVLVTGTIVAPVQLPRPVLLTVVAGLGVLAGAVFWSPLGHRSRLPATVRQDGTWFPGWPEDLAEPDPRGLNVLPGMEPTSSQPPGAA